MTRIARSSIMADCKYFHILTMGLPREGVFSADNLKRFYINTLEEKAKDMDVSILAYCVMENHSHLILTAKDLDAIPEFMRRINTTYAKFYNRIRTRSGYVFKGRYESEALNGKQDVLDCINFIHNNPVVNKQELFSGDYPFSSASSYMFGGGIVDGDALISLFGDIPELTAYVTGKYKFKEEKPSEDCDKVLLDLIKKYHITQKSVLQDPEILKSVIAELQARSGVSLRDVAYLLGLDREKVRRTALKK